MRAKPNSPSAPDISCTLFLSDIGDYDGGELVVSDTYGEHEVRLPAGDAIVYPSSSLHRVTPVTRGVRVASFLGSSYGARRCAAPNAVELDTSIETLRRTGANADAVLQLTNISHNLPRRWAVVYQRFQLHHRRLHVSGRRAAHESQVSPSAEHGTWKSPSDATVGLTLGPCHCAPVSSENQSTARRRSARPRSCKGAGGAARRAQRMSASSQNTVLTVAPTGPGQLRNPA